MGTNGYKWTKQAGAVFNPWQLRSRKLMLRESDSGSIRITASANHYIMYNQHQSTCKQHITSYFDLHPQLLWCCLTTCLFPWDFLWVPGCVAFDGLECNAFILLQLQGSKLQCQAILGLRWGDRPECNIEATEAKASFSANMCNTVMPSCFLDSLLHLKTFQQTHGLPTTKATKELILHKYT